MAPTVLQIGAAYIRVSTDDQTELLPDAQLRVILEEAKKDGFIIPPEYIFIEHKGISGRKASNRPEFQRMVSIAKSQQPAPFKRLYLWKFSRFARNQEESIVYKSLLRKNNVQVVSISEPLPDGPFAPLIERIIEWMDEYYSIRLSGEVKRGMKEKAKKQTSVWMSAFFLQNAAAVLLTSVQKCDLIYTERFCIVKTVGARTKQFQIAK